jgi:[ribosomal protein S18]-alanine N-acetyltransferase
LAYLVRKATIQDAAEMIRLERQCPTTTHWTEQQYLDLLAAMRESPTRLALVTQEDGSSALAGFLVARHSPPELELENIVVAPEVRRTGIGKKLMDTLLVLAGQANSDAILLEVRESNAAARRLYEKLGFRETGRRKAYYTHPGEDAVLYSKILV